MLRIVLPVLIYFTFVLAVQGQQAAQYSLYMFNKTAYNPAYVGLDNLLTITGTYRKQWVDLEGSPTSQQLNIHLPLFFINSGVGIAFQNDQLGVERNLSPELMYSYQIPLSRKSLLSVGVGAGFIQKSLNGANIRTPDGDYQDIFDHKDDLLPISNVSGNATRLSAGIYYLSEKFEIGLSTKNILEQKIDLNPATILPTRAYFFSAIGYFDLSNTLKLQPSMFVKSDILQTQLEFSALINYNDNILIGASFRGYSPVTIDAAAIIGGWQLAENTRIMYSYDLTLSNLRTVSSGTHEILLTYAFDKEIGKGVPPPIIYNPRF